MKKEKLNNNSNQDVNNGKVVKKKERHIVSWSQEEDDILREQIQLHGSENWTIIASKFKDKTTRQCRRRWFSYLNSDFKKGGWSPEEDILLCEAQRKYGNRWTEIAKVVSGRTDNAVKNRFITLCKKKEKHAVNSTTSYVNLNNKRVTFRDEGSENAAPLKKIRACISSIIVHHKHEEESAVECGAVDNLLVHPSTGIGRKVESCEALVDKSTENRSLHMFLSKDDPKLLALTQQAQLLSCLANKVNTDTTDQSLENTWMTKECRTLKATEGDTDFQVEKLKGLEVDLGSCDEGSRSSSREVDMCESSPASSENSTRSTLVTNVACDKTEECDAEIACETGHILQEEKLHQHCVSERNVVHHEVPVKIMPTYEEVEANNGSGRDYPNTEFSSPTHVTPLFTTLAAAVPTPKFSESEKHFLMKTLGLESTSPSPIKNPSQPPPCKRSLLHCL